MIRYVLFLTFSVAFVRASHTRNQCPDPTKISPCVCHQFCHNCPPVITCSKIQSISVLQEILQKSGDVQFPSVIYSDVKIPYLPSTSVETKRSIRLAITNSSLESLFDQQPSESSLLQEIFLNDVRLSSGIRWDLLSSLHSLKSLVISNTEVPNINDTFGLLIPKQVRSIHFSKTKTVRISGSAFAPLRNLESVIIRSSRIQKVERSMFTKPLRVKILDLSDNKIRSLPDNFFSDMPNLGSVLLSKNNITNFKESVFGNLPIHLKSISIRDNPIRCDCSIKWITERPRLPYIDGQCSDPENLAGKRIRSLRSSDFENCSRVVHV